jgi:hypothetical protein
MSVSTLALTRISKTFRSPDLHGVGLSFSSTEAVLKVYLAALLAGHRLSPSELIHRALADERVRTGRAIASNDVGPVVVGNGVLTVTNPPNPVPYIVPIHPHPAWIADHTVVAFNPNGSTHDAGRVLEHLFTNPAKGRSYIREINFCTLQALNSCTDRNIQQIGAAITEYKSILDRWTKGLYSAQVTRITVLLQREFGADIVATKCPGAGAAEALMIICRKPCVRSRIITFLERLGWIAWQAKMTGGVRREAARPGGITVSAGFRLDLIGAADLGLDSSISEPGWCMAIAIEPRAEAIAKFIRA